MTQRLTPTTILAAYRIGFFPMADPGGRIRWYNPDPRSVLELDDFHVPRSLRQVIRRGVFEVRINTAFAEVMAACADRDEGTWISPEIYRVYNELHRLGHVHSVESWREGRLVGGLYGVAIGAAFFGESMFHRETNASKVALATLMERLRGRGYVLLDCQMTTPHLLSLGATEIPQSIYLQRLTRAVAQPRRFVDAPNDTQVEDG